MVTEDSESSEESRVFARRRGSVAEVLAKIFAIILRGQQTYFHRSLGHARGDWFGHRTLD
jgi:hypothetical protein